MSVKINIMNKFSTESNTLLCGILSTEIVSSNSLTSLPEYNSENNISIVLDKNTFSDFKRYFNKAPTIQKLITLYDQNGFTIVKYPELREDNKPGTVEISTEPKVQLGDIIIPIATDSQTFLVLTSYHSLVGVIRKKTKEQIILQDMAILCSKYDLSKVILFITDSIYNDVNTYCDLSKIFKKVNVEKNQEIIPSLVEYIAGATISGSKPEFQGLLNFGTNVEITKAYFSNIQNHIDAKIRTNECIHFTSHFTNSSSYFIILLSHSTCNDINITESTTHTQYEIDVSPEKNTITDEHMEIMINGLLFMEELQRIIDYDDFIKYSLLFSQKIVLYIYKSPLDIFKYNPSMSNIDDIINNYMYNLKEQICEKLKNPHPIPLLPPMPCYLYPKNIYQSGPHLLGLERQVSVFNANA